MKIVKLLLAIVICAGTMFVVNAVIMDIFVGSGTTLKVARDLHRDSIGIEIKEDYCQLIMKRLTGGNQQLFNEIKLIKSNG